MKRCVLCAEFCDICDVLLRMNVAKSVKIFPSNRVLCFLDGTASCRLTWRCWQTLRHGHMTDSPCLEERYYGIFLLPVMDGDVKIQIEFEVL